MFCQFDGPSGGAVVLREVRGAAGLQRSAPFWFCPLHCPATCLSYKQPVGRLSCGLLGHELLLLLLLPPPPPVSG